MLCTLSLLFLLGLCCIWPSVSCFAGAVQIPVLSNGIYELKLDSSTERTTTERIHFLPPKHAWRVSNNTSHRPYQVMDFEDHTKQSFSGLLKRSRRKVISRAGHYILRSKTDGSTWGSPTGAAPGTYDSKAPGAYTGGFNTRERLSELSFAGSGRKATRNYHGRRGNKGNNNARKKISQNLKMEIGQYALQKGAKEAADQYAGRVGRRLKERIVEKFARRFRLKQERRLERMKEGKTRYLESY